MNIEAILERLEKVSRNGDSYTACCPVHEDKTPSLNIKEADGKIIAHCFGCDANGVVVVEALGLPTEVLFEKKLEYKSDRRSKLIWYLNEEEGFDEEVINITYHELKNKKDICKFDLKVISQALSRRKERRKLGLPIVRDMELKI